MAETKKKVKPKKTAKKAAKKAVKKTTKKVTTTTRVTASTIKAPTKPLTSSRAKETSPWTTINMALLALAGILILVNQVIIGGLDGGSNGGMVSRYSGSSSASLGAVDLSQITSTAQSVAALFPVGDIQTTQDAIDMMISTGTPEYSDAFGGISFDDPVGSVDKLGQMYAPLKAKIQQEDPETFQRYINLASSPVGISCEFCCGVGPAGIDSKGNLRCGCKHNRAAQSIALGLMASTDYSDAEVLKEVLKWKSLFFPQNMVTLAADAAGGNIPAGNLPKQVGGC